MHVLKPFDLLAGASVVDWLIATPSESRGLPDAVIEIAEKRTVYATSSSVTILLLMNALASGFAPSVRALSPASRAPAA